MNASERLQGCPYHAGMDTTGPDFGAYLRDIIDRHPDWDNGADLARAANVNQANISRYLNGATRPTIDNARAIARAIGRPLLEVLVEGGALTPGEAGQPVAAKVDPASLSDTDLVAEIVRRFGGGARVVPGPTRAQIAADPDRYLVIPNSPDKHPA